MINDLNSSKTYKQFYYYFWPTTDKFSMSYNSWNGILYTCYDYSTEWPACLHLPYKGMTCQANKQAK